LTLIEEEPDLAPLRNDLLRLFAGKDVRHSELLKWLLRRRWREPQLNTVLRKLHGDKLVSVVGSAKLVFSADPMLTFEVQ
jgi:hypothetical protein